MSDMDFQFCCCSKDFQNYCGKMCHKIFYPSGKRKKNARNQTYCSRECENESLQDPKDREIKKLKGKIQKLEREIEEKDQQLNRLKKPERDEDGLEKLNEKIDKLEMDIKRKDEQIKNMCKPKESEQSKEGGKDVSPTEDNVDPEPENPTYMESLNKRIRDLSNENKNLKEELEASNKLAEKLKVDVDEINGISREMLSTIRTLEEQNVAYENEVKRLKKITGET